MAERVLRCAVYTRKSTEEGLEQDFNSLHAQREACEAYVLSQKSEGWMLVPTAYDDGGWSGGNMERPALKALLEDIRTGKIDIVVVYKVDRLTRSLADFARIVDIFDARQASFVSVTQSFNTTTSMGRLTLNVLLSFAQFEREVTAERIRDKISASKAKGMWMGGIPPLGYRVEERKLVVVDEEAKLVRHIYERYLAFGAVDAVVLELRRHQIRSRVYVGRSGHQQGGGYYGRGALYGILRNPLYRGLMRHRDKVYPAQHEAIIDEPLWEAVQARVAERQQEHQFCLRGSVISVLNGLIRDDQGLQLGSTFSSKGGRRYRYYSTREHQQATAVAAGKNPKPIWRIPASDLEEMVTDLVCRHLGDPHWFIETLKLKEGPALAESLHDAREMIEQLNHGSAAERRRLLMLLIDQIEVAESGVTVMVRPGAMQKGAPLDPSPVSLHATARLVRSGQSMRLVDEGAANRVNRDAALIRLVASAHAARQLMMTSPGKTIDEMARQMDYSTGYFSTLVRIGQLAPDITSMILEGRQPPELTSVKLARWKGIPKSWAGQRKVLALG